MSPNMSDIFLFFTLNKNCVVEGSMGLYLDNSIGAGDKHFEQIIKRT